MEGNLVVKLVATAAFAWAAGSCWQTYFAFGGSDDEKKGPAVGHE
jgi:hypothetical protein